jgi:hypothetical protein
VPAVVLDQVGAVSDQQPQVCGRLGRQHHLLAQILAAVHQLGDG